MTAATIEIAKTQCATAKPRGVSAKKTAAPVDELQVRLGKLRAAIREADQKLEMSYDAAETGESVWTLLGHIAHDLLIGDALAMLEDAPTKADAAKTHEALFVPLAALDAAITLARGSVIEQTLREAWQLLDWVQSECDSMSIAKLLPEPAAQTEATMCEIRSDYWMDLDCADGCLHKADILLEMALEACQWQFSDAEQSERAQERIIVMLNAIDAEVTATRKSLTDLIEEAQEAR